MKKDTVRFDGKSMDYCCFGSGKKTIILVPGVSLCRLAGSVEAIASAYKLFYDEYTVYLFDRKDEMEEGYSVEAMSEDTVLAMKALGIGKSGFIGCSQGGMISLVAAMNHPEMVERVMLSSSASRVNPTVRATVGKWTQWAKNGEKKRLVYDMADKLITKEFAERYYPYEFFMKTSQEDMRRFIIMCEAVLSFDVYDRLEEIKCPVCVVGADTDEVLSPEASREIAEKLGCERHIFAGYRHAVYDECPEVKKVYAEFFGVA